MVHARFAGLDAPGLTGHLAVAGRGVHHGSVDLIGAPRYDLPSHLWPSPKLRGVSHAIAAVAVVPLGILLLRAAGDGRARVAAGVYLVAQLVVFVTSATYHLVAREPEVRRRMQLADHSMIYVLIAGTWVPLCLLVLPPGWGVATLAVILAMAATGIGLKLAGVHRFPRSSNTIYLAMGWVGLFALPAIVHRVPATALALLAIGGVVYSLGALVLMMKRPDPSPRFFGYHEIWHACTVAAAACHFAMVWMVAA